MATYSYSGKVQVITVAATGEYIISASGAQGGASSFLGSYGALYSYAGGNGATVTAGFNLTQGEKLEIVVGGAGQQPTGNVGGGGGGGGTFVFAGDGSGRYTLLEAAGGGGGGAYNGGGDGQASKYTANGYNGGGLRGRAGYGATNGIGAGGAGLKSGGANSVNGYTGGANAEGAFAGGGGGSRGYGGAGGFGGGGSGDYAVVQGRTGVTGGGGGGGYTGGAGGGSVSLGSGGGAGGGSYISSTAIANTTAETTGANSGDGAVSLIAAADSGAFAETGTVQTVTILQSAEYVLTASGAQGGSLSNHAGGDGATVSGEFALTTGEILKVVVGGQGTGITGGQGAGGGGGTFVFASTDGGVTYSLLEAAGGGGGASGNYDGGAAQTTTSGAGGYDTYAGAGGTNGSYGVSDHAGGGAGVRGNAMGTTSYGATAGNFSTYAGGAAAPNSGAGGFGGGGGGSYVNSNGARGIGGGGGGYSGGGAGGFDAYAGSGGSGGGGGSYVASSATNTVETATHTGNGAFSFAIVCFAEGTRILAERGEVPVESLAVGDLVRTASGELRPVKWLGHRRIDVARHADPESVLPIRIAAHALGENRPSRDLLLSPAHAVAVNVFDEVLVPAAALVNGATIRQVEVSEITYWHVELDSHDLLMAENLATESYIDMGNRRFFVEGGIVDLAAPMETPAEQRTQADYCRPFVHSGPAVDALAALTVERAKRMGWTLADDVYGDMHLIVDGERIAPKVEGLVARFDMPSGARNVWLASSATRPVDVGVNRDPRRLGLSLLGLTVEDGLQKRHVAMDDARLAQGFHAYEGWHRWTDGRARLPASMFRGLAERCVLTVRLAAPALPRWVQRAEKARTTLAA